MYFVRVSEYPLSVVTALPVAHNIEWEMRASEAV